MARTLALFTVTVLASLGATASASAAECVGARNNPAFSSSAATGAADPCRSTAKPAVTATARPLPAGKPNPSALDIPAKTPKAKTETSTSVDDQGRTVYRTGETEVRVGGYVRVDAVSRSGNLKP